MGKTFVNLLIFAAGAAIGSGITYMLMKDQYEIIPADPDESENIDSSDEDNQSIEEEKEDYADIITNNNYSTYNKEEVKTHMENKPYVISPAEFGEIYEYDTSSLTYYSDGVLTDEDNKPIENVDEIVGEDSLNHFGEYEDDSVFVRNDKFKIDYEILADVRKYEDTL